MKKLLILLFSLTYSFSHALQDSSLVIGIERSEPFVMIGPEGPKGLSVDFWKLVERQLKVDYQFKTYPNLPALLEGVSKGEVDLSINPITVSEERMARMAFSQPFFISGTSYVRQRQNNWLGVLRNFFSWQFFSALAVLLVVIFIFGLLIWFFERRRNRSQFSTGLQGLGDGFWWSAVTMTTVGYGDKAPVTRGGRIVGFIWMFAAILIISGLTASIASALTVSTLDERIDGVEDLRRFSVASIAGSNSASYLTLFGVSYQSFEDVEEALLAAESGEVEVVVYDRPILRYHLQAMELDELVLSPKNLKTDYYSFSYPRGSRLQELIDPLVVRALKSSEWNYRLQRLENNQ